jgi:DNA-binding MarR family transcriptional regulator
VLRQAGENATSEDQERRMRQYEEEAVKSLRALILAGERYRQVIAQHVGLGTTETQAISYLTVHGDRGQNELAADLGLSSGASTALVDRLERQGIAERYPHPHDRRRTLVRLTDQGRGVVQESRQWLWSSFQDIPSDELESLSRSLRSVAQRLADRSAETARRDSRSQDSRTEDSSSQDSRTPDGR